MIRRGGLLGAVGVAVLLAGCGSTTPATTAQQAGVSTPPAVSAQQAEQANGDCTSALTGHEVRVTIYGGGERACEGFDRGAAKSAEEFWKIVQEEPHGTPVCSMEREALVMEVRDGGGQFYGTHLCARLLALGWREAEGPGEKDERQLKETEVRQREQRAKQEAQQVEEERPAHEAAALKLMVEAGSLRRRERAERADAKHDEAEAKRIEVEAEHTEGEASDSLYQRADETQQHADAHEQAADGFESEASSKEDEATSERQN